MPLPMNEKEIEQLEIIKQIINHLNIKNLSGYKDKSGKRIFKIIPSILQGKMHARVNLKNALYDFVREAAQQNKITTNLTEFNHLCDKLSEFKDAKPWNKENVSAIHLSETEEKQLTIINELITSIEAAIGTFRRYMEESEKKAFTSLKRTVTGKGHASVQFKNTLYTYATRLLNEKKITQEIEQFEKLCNELNKFKNDRPWLKKPLEEKEPRIIIRKKEDTVQLILNEEEEALRQTIEKLCDFADIMPGKVAMEGGLIVKNLPEALRKERHFSKEMKNQLWQYFSECQIDNPEFKKLLKDLEKGKDKKYWKKKGKRKSELGVEEANQLSVIRQLIDLAKKNNPATAKGSMGIKSFKAKVYNDERHLSVKDKGNLYKWLQGTKVCQEDKEIFTKLLSELEKFKDNKPWKKQKTKEYTATKNTSLSVSLSTNASSFFHHLNPVSTLLDTASSVDVSRRATKESFDELIIDQSSDELEIDMDTDTDTASDSSGMDI